jgi:hypothetical protein
MFRKIATNNDSEIDWAGFDQNHYTLTSADDGGAIVRGTNYTTGPPQLDASGRPLAGSPLLGRIAPLNVRTDAEGAPRSEPADVGAYELP